MLHTHNNTDGNKLMKLCSIALYHGYSYITIPAAKQQLYSIIQVYIIQCFNSTILSKYTITYIQNHQESASTASDIPSYTVKVQQQLSVMMYTMLSSSILSKNIIIVHCHTKYPAISINKNLCYNTSTQLSINKNSRIFNVLIK